MFEEFCIFEPTVFTKWALHRNNWNNWITLETIAERPHILYGLPYTPSSNIILIWFRYTKIKRASSPFLIFHFQESLHLVIPEEPESVGRKKLLSLWFFFPAVSEERSSTTHNTRTFFRRFFASQPLTQMPQVRLQTELTQTVPGLPRTPPFSNVILSPTRCNYCLKASNSVGEIALGLWPCFVEK